MGTTVIAFIVLCIIISIVYAVWVQSGSEGSISSNTIQDGSSLTFGCQGKGTVQVLKATYGPATSDVASSCQTVDVTNFMQNWARTGKTFTVGPYSFTGVDVPSCAGIRMLSIHMSYDSCGHEKFIPQRIDVCSKPPLPMTGFQDSDRVRLDTWKGAVATTPWDLNDQIQVAAALEAGSRELHYPINPLTRIGSTHQVPLWLYHGNTAGASVFSPCSAAVSEPGQPGFLLPKARASTDGTEAQQRYHHQPAYWQHLSNSTVLHDPVGLL